MFELGSKVIAAEACPTCDGPNDGCRSCGGRGTIAAQESQPHIGLVISQAPAEASDFGLVRVQWLVLGVRVWENADALIQVAPPTEASVRQAQKLGALR